MARLDRVVMYDQFQAPANTSGDWLSFFETKLVLRYARQGLCNPHTLFFTCCFPCFCLHFRPGSGSMGALSVTNYRLLFHPALVLDVDSVQVTTVSSAFRATDELTGTAPLCPHPCSYLVARGPALRQPRAEHAVAHSSPD